MGEWCFDSSNRAALVVHKFYSIPPFGMKMSRPPYFVDCCCSPLMVPLCCYHPFHRLEFVPPESMAEDASYSCKGDVYSFGMCVLEMISGKYPYSECADGEAIKAKARGGLLPEAFDAIVVDEYRTYRYV